MSYKDKVVIITGASSGIGAAAAEAFSAEGAHVVMVGRNEEKLAAVAKRCNQPLIIKADVSIEEEVKNIINQTIGVYGKLDVLVNNAGVSWADGSLLNENTLKCFDELMSVNVRAAVQLSNLAASHLVKTKGNIVNISSIAGHMPLLSSGSIHYSITKAALNQFTRCAAAELGPLGVRVNAISPGPVRTDFITNSNFTPLTWDDCVQFTALGRVSNAGEIADLILYLAGDKAMSITGSIMVIDNGSTINPVKVV